MEEELTVDLGDAFTGTQLLGRVIDPDQVLKEIFHGEVFSDLRKGNLNEKEYKELVQLIERIKNIQVLLRNIHRKHIEAHKEEIARRIAKEWAAKLKEREEYENEDIDELAELLLPRAIVYVETQLAERDFYPSYHYKLLAQKLALSGSKNMSFIKMFFTKLIGKVEEKKGGLFK